MEECRVLAGRNLRYVLTETLFGRGPLTVGELVQAMQLGEFVVRGRASKTISDALRWEIAPGRVVRMGRGLYGPGRMPKQTRSWIRCRVRRLAYPSSPNEQQQSTTPPTNATIQPPAPAPAPAPAADTFNRTSDDPDQVGAVGGDPISGRAADTGQHPAGHRDPGPSRHPDTGADEVVVMGAGWDEGEEAANWAADVEAALASLAAEAALASLAADAALPSLAADAAPGSLSAEAAPARNRHQTLEASDPVSRKGDQYETA